MGKKSLVKTTPSRGVQKPEHVIRIDFTTPEALAELEKSDAEIKEARRLAEIQRAKEAEEKRKQQALRDEEQWKIMRDINRKKFENNPPPFKPSRLISVDSDVEIMNISEDLASVKETVNHIETMLWEIEDYLYKDDKQKQENLKLKKLKRKAKKQ